MGEVRAEFPKKSIEEIIGILNHSKVDGKLFKFLLKERVYIRCPTCKHKKTALYKKKSRYACRECWRITYKIGKPNRRRTVYYHEYVRPLRILAELEQKMLGKLTERQQQMTLKQIEKLRKAIPEYIHSLRENILKKAGGKL